MQDSDSTSETESFANTYIEQQRYEISQIRRKLDAKRETLITPTIDVNTRTMNLFLNDAVKIKPPKKEVKKKLVLGHSLKQNVLQHLILNTKVDIKKAMVKLSEITGTVEHI